MSHTPMSPHPGLVRAILLSLAGVVLFVVGLASIPQDLTTWFHWLRFVSTAVPWWVLILLALVALGFGLGPGVMKWWKAQGSAPNEQIALLKERLRLAELTEKFAKDQHEADQRQLNETRTELLGRVDGLLKELEDCKEQGRSFYQFLTYGQGLVVPTPLEHVERAIMRARVEEMMPTLSEVFRQARRVWAEVAVKMLETGEQSSHYWLADFVNRHVRAPAEKSFERLRNEVAEKGRDPRAILPCVYARYCDWRAWIVRAAGLLHMHPGELAGYSDWQRSDAEFFQSLPNRLAISELADVRSAVKSYNDDHGHPHRLLSVS